MITYLLVTLLAGLLFGILAGVYVGVWTQPGFVLDGLATWLYSLGDWYAGDCTDPAQHRRHIHAEWILKPLLTCGYCVGGQMGLWGFALLTYRDPLPLLCYILSAGVASLVGGLIDNLILPKP